MRSLASMTALIDKKLRQNCTQLFYFRYFAAFKAETHLRHKKRRIKRLILRVVMLFVLAIIKLIVLRSRVFKAFGFITEV